MEDCLTYFRQAIHDPLGVQPWSEWWKANADLARATFSHLDFVRLQHRRLRGAREILQRRGELPEDFTWRHLESCGQCGERREVSGGIRGGVAVCPHCGGIATFSCRPATTFIAVRWLHGSPSYPVELFSEIDTDRYEIRKVERFADGSFGFADSIVQSGTTMLGTEPLPSLEEIAKDSEFVPREISSDEFFTVWNAARNSVR